MMKLSRRETFKIIAAVGLVLLVAGLLRYSIEGLLSPLSEGLMIGGGALLALSAALNLRAIGRALGRRSARLGANTLVMVVAALVILVAVNYVAFRHDKRFDWTAERLYTLSDQTQHIVRSLKKDVTFILFSQEPNPVLDQRMAEYQALSRHIHFERVDPQEHPEIARQYGVARRGQMIAVSGGRTERLEQTDEQDITNALLKATENTVKTVCFVTGHGEKSVDSGEADGYSGVEQELVQEAYLVKTVNLVTSGQVPADCTVVVEAGPTRPLFPQEAAMIEKYLDGGGGALLLVDPETDSGLSSVFQAWNIAVGDNIVIDASGIGRLFQMGPTIPLVVDYGSSPVTRGFERTMTFFPLARTVDLASNTKFNPQITELFRTSPASWATPKITGTRLSFDPAHDTKGPLCLGVAAVRQQPGKPARMVVIGDSDFATNRWIGLQRNGDLFFNAIGWLTGSENLISIRPKSPANRRVTMTTSQERVFTWVTLVFLPGLVIASGIWIWWRRR
jgi:gliding motility-associatede transport system auxiliary component